MKKVLEDMVKHPVYALNQTEKLYSNMEVAAKLGMSSRTVMKHGRDTKLVAPEGQSNEYGTWKSPNSPHECPQWYWKETGLLEVFKGLKK